jgi:hypothetical protein
LVGTNSRRKDRSPLKKQRSFLKRKKVYDPKEAINREKSSKKKPVKALVDSKWTQPPGSESTNIINRSVTGRLP